MTTYRSTRGRLRYRLNHISARSRQCETEIERRIADGQLGGLGGFAAFSRYIELAIRSANHPATHMRVTALR